MRYQQFRPDRALQPWVECYWQLTGEAASPAPPQRILPDGSVEIVIHLGDPFARIAEDASVERQSPFLFVGQMIQPLRVAATGRTHVWGVRLHPWAVAAVAGRPGSELTNRIEAADAVCPRLARDLVAALSDVHGRSHDGSAPRQMVRPASSQRGGTADDAGRCVRALDDVLTRHLRGAAPLDPLVVAAGRQLLRQGGPIGAMADRLGVSARQLERAFLHAVGLTPKMFGRIARFQRVAAVLDEAPAGVLASVALECGYYDQSHLVRDVRAFAGDTPVALRAALEGELADYFLRARRTSHFSKPGDQHPG